MRVEIGFPTYCPQMALLRTKEDELKQVIAMSGVTSLSSQLESVQAELRALNEELVVLSKQSQEQSLLLVKRQDLAVKQERLRNLYTLVSVLVNLTMSGSVNWKLRYCN